jgi:hypothetical protein
MVSRFHRSGFLPKAVVIEIPSTGERVAVQRVEERFGPLCLRVEGARAIGYVLPSVLEIGLQ